MSNVERTGAGQVGWGPVPGEQSEAKARTDATETAAPAQTTATTASWGADHASHAAALEARLGATAPPPPKPSFGDRVLGWFGSAADEVKDAGETLTSAAGDLKDKVSSGVSGTLHAAGAEARSIAGRLSDLASGAEKKVVSGARSIGNDLVGVANKAENAIKDGFNEVVEDAKKVGKAVESKTVEVLNDAAGAAARLRDKGKELLAKIDDALDPKDEIEALETNGSTLTIALGAKASVEVGGSAKGTCSVKMVEEPKGSKPKYEVTLSGEVGVSLALELGAKAGAKADAKGEVSAGVKGAVTFECSSPEEAARIVRIAGRMAASAGVSSSVPGLGTVAGAMLAPGADDMKFLADRAGSIELSGSAAAKISAELGIGADKEELRLIGADVGAGAAVEQGISIKLPRGGKPAEITLKRSFEVSAEAKIGVAGPIGPSAGAEGKLKVEVEQKFTLPAKVDGAKLRDDPLGTIKSVAGEIARSAEAKVTLSRSLKAEAGFKVGGKGKEISVGGAGKGGGEVEASVSFSANLRNLGQAFGAAVKTGSLEGALSALDKNIQVEAKMEGKTFEGFHIAPEISAFGVGVGIEAQYETAHKHELGEFKGSPSEAVKKLGEQLKSVTANTGKATGPKPTPAPAPPPVLVHP